MKNSNNSLIGIRLASEEDYSSVMDLYRDSYANERKAIPEPYDLIPPSPLRRGTYINILEDEEDTIYVAELDQKIVGVINFSVESLSATSFNEAFVRVTVDTLIVAEEHRRKGIGQLLMATAEGWAREKGMYDITLIVYSYNTTAISFYEANGYESYSVRMRKKLQK